MGLTVHYELQSKTKSQPKAVALLERVRQLALDLPFDWVTEIRVIDDPKILYASLDYLREHNRANLWSVMEATRHYTLPWTKVIHFWKGKTGGINDYRNVTQRSKSVEIRPTSIIEFDTMPADGSESATFRMAQYPSEIEVTWNVSEDKKYLKKAVGRQGVEWNFDWNKYHRDFGRLAPYYGHSEQRTIKTRLGGWLSSSFCKTQYASEPESGGVANFLKGHIALVTLLERASEIPGLDVSYNDEGKYGTSNYTDDPSAEPVVYYDHPGKYSAAALANEVGEWNGMLAAMGGMFKDAFDVAGLQVEGSILDMSNFEQLEFRGTQDERIKPFLEVMNKVALSQRRVEVA